MKVNYRIFSNNINGYKSYWQSYKLAFNVYKYT